ncbi:hypothetical protein BCR34DRAFT_575758 [Clohesyomyces aquaticus]|uniref:Uncharacterized protein n=1 Tax=Clohesyomyces aquaticus TaxID=1231657 RepID=A0A1Y1YQQ5_9PLEO|nr:hypothetical protein BCR34DRAFT_575758 [Clohesyomyces aquaticus]
MGLFDNARKALATMFGGGSNDKKPLPNDNTDHGMSTNNELGQMGTGCIGQGVGQRIRRAVNNTLNRARCLFKRTANWLADAVQGIKDWMREHPYLTAAIAVSILLLIIGPFIPHILAAAGFGPAGIVAGSLAAGIHASISSVAAGSTFAILTSAGMAGYGVPIVLGIYWGLTVMFASCTIFFVVRAH